MRRFAIALAAAGVISVAGAGVAFTETMDWGKYQAGDKRSGYTYAQPETRAMQDDEFENPGFLLMESATAMWSKPEGAAGKSCADCHGDVSSMKGVATRYPVFFKPSGKMMNIEQRINQCRTEQMKAEPWKWESDQLLGMTVLVKYQSEGLPMNVAIDGPAAPFYEKGKAFYYERRGQLDLACSNCHEDHSGQNLRANILSQGMPNGFPTYRLKWQKVGSLHRRFKGCNDQVRAEPYKPGSDEYVDLELFVSHRANGLPVETPSVRN
ncbi:sulfur-oxidizing protein SoxA [Tistlia consotensis]|uniref:SoxAX cytochrome complex subunit A n=1 Tax=Tistlia consotensis USBA 355 TaxID=560819 RepID=A0A1Y6B379_9PROT|nr:sulfur oxidation c-type cytochrome SoxA [Tistlia consotensis]SME89120.1 diheme cytochrome SoxA (sulfur oxidation) [Tistlia consotensis USBA 355]SNR25690.1 sulfur-oxidizing protein SoxA [Tistlia consotensis]